jgi:protocatechuate 3,4-dioxygenase beta subunit
MKLLIPLTALFVFTSSCGSQDKDKHSADSKSKTIVGGGCEGCESVFESPVPFEKLTWIDTLPDFNDAGPQMEISGIIYESDGVTPAPEVVLYVYHTDQSGYYPKKGDETGWGKRHGYLRGWVKTNEKGEYKFYTLRPARYPTNESPAHIHAIVKEPDKNEYWIEDYVFDDDSLIDDNYRKQENRRGGMGIIKPVKNEQGLLTGKRDITLGKHIPNYSD